jgi:hypothetical protein
MKGHSESLFIGLLNHSDTSPLTGWIQSVSLWSHRLGQADQGPEPTWESQYENQFIYWNLLFVICFLVVLGFELRTSMLAKEALYYLSLPPALLELFKITFNTYRVLTLFYVPYLY